jgi:hypothetical protein
VLAIAIVGRRSGLRRIGDQRIGRGRFDPAETARDGASCGSALPAHRGEKRVVAAGIQDHQPQVLRAVGRGHEPLQWNRLVLGVAIAGKPGVDRDQIVCASDLQPVPGEIDHRDVGLIRRRFEPADRPFELEISDIELDVDRVEPGIAEQLRNRARIARRIRELRHCLIVGIPDNQRHPFAIETTTAPIITAIRVRRLIIPVFANRPSVAMVFGCQTQPEKMAGL